MNYEAFKNAIAADVASEMVNTDIGPVTVTFHVVKKVNCEYDAMTVTPKNSKIGVNLDISSLYEEYQKSDDYTKSLKTAEIAITKGLSCCPDVNVASLMDYDNMKKTLVMEVISKDANADILKNVPHHDIEDMAVVYRLVLDSTDAGKSTVLVTNNLLDNYGISAEQLWEDALENAPIVRPAQIKGMSEIMYEMMGPDAEAMGIPQIDPADEKMFVATVSDKTCGAGVLAYPNFMEEAAEKIGGSYFVLPSSIHEVILVPDDGRMDAQELENMVKDVNATQVDAADKLTDHVYHYDVKMHVFTMVA